MCKNFEKIIKIEENLQLLNFRIRLSVHLAYDPTNQTVPFPFLDILKVQVSFFKNWTNLLRCRHLIFSGAHGSDYVNEFIRTD